MKTTVPLSLLALGCFAANSVLCRLALGAGEIDPVGFTAIRLVSGALALWLIAAGSRRTLRWPHGGSWLSGAMLFLYAIAFSLAYLTMGAGVGALILFGSVQLTMLSWGWLGGERPHALQWAGLTAAASGLLILVFPGLTAPSPWGAFWMTLAGMAWGIYSLRGRGITDPVAATADNFLRSVPMILTVVLFWGGEIHLTPRGIFWAIVSGALTSGIGYVVWYTALKGLSATRASIIQLAVPVLAAVGGVAFLSERVSHRLFIAAVATLGGVALAMRLREKTNR